MKKADGRSVGLNCNDKSKNAMIKYVIKTGDKSLNEMARIQVNRDCKVKLRGMRCSKHKGEDTVIEFVKTESEYGRPYVRPEIHACCEEFRERIWSKLKDQA